MHFVPKTPPSRNLDNRVFYPSETSCAHLGNLNKTSEILRGIVKRGCSIQEIRPFLRREPFDQINARGDPRRRTRVVYSAADNDPLTLKDAVISRGPSLPVVRFLPVRHLTWS